MNNDKDLSTPGGPPSSPAATANLLNGGAEAIATPRPRRHRHPVRTTHGEANTEVGESAAEAKPATEASAVPSEATDGAAQNATTPTETNRATRSRRGGRPRNEKTPPTPEASAPAAPPITTEPVLVAPSRAPVAHVTHEKKSLRQTIAPSAPPPQSTPVPPPVVVAAPVESAAVEAPSSTHRYRFDRRPANATTPSPAAVTSPAQAPLPANELRRSGAFSNLWGRPATPAPTPLAPPVSAPTPTPVSASGPQFGAAAPLEVIAPTPGPAPVAPPPLAPTPTPVVSAKVQTEPEEIVLPLFTPPTPVAVQSAPVAAPQIQVIETLAEDDAESDEPENTTGLSEDARRANGRRRRRGGRNGNSLPHAEMQTEERPAVVAAPTPLPSTPQPRYQQPQPTYQQPQQTYQQPAPMEPPATAYGSPEPAHARGFGPVTRGVASEYRTPPTFSRSSRVSEGAPISANHLAGIIMDAMQQQTDRLLSEQRRHGASTFTIAMPSTERVGVFVDVANLLYSSRSMRLPIDFGRLLNFLRGDRRLVRAHAYCPTSPEPFADQQFLQAVKGLGYRITTKDYKTFSSGAKKADLDLDLCMDIVRIVDADAVDTIVLVSGDSDFLPLLDYCADHGVRVEVAAFDESTAAILRQSCDLFMNLSVVEEIRA